MLYTETTMIRKEVTFREELVITIHSLTKDRQCQSVNVAMVML